MTRRPQRGLALLETVVTAVLLAATLMAGLYGMNFLNKRQVAAEAVSAINAYEDVLRKEISRRARSYFRASAPSCTAAGFDAAVTGDMANGIRLEPVTSSTPLPDANLGPRALKAKNRCLLRQHARVASFGFAAHRGVYFCLAFSATPSAVGIAAGVGAMQPFFAEMYFMSYDVMTGSRYACNDLAPWPSDATTTLLYAFYWTVGGTTFKHFEGQLVVGGL